MKNRNMIFDFTQCYPKRKEPGLEWHDCSEIGGSRLYCSRDAEEKIKELPDEVPVYISIDKDVLDEKYAVTNWDQGKMSMGMLEQILKTLVTEYDVIGVDICGMYPEENSLPEYLRAERVNIRSDEELYRFLQKNFFCWASHK